MRAVQQVFSLGMGPWTRSQWALAVSLFLILSPAAVHAQPETEPRLYLLELDPPFAGAEVRVNGAPAGSTDAAGKVLIQGVPPGAHPVSVRLRGTSCGVAEVHFDPDLNSLGRFPLQCGIWTLDTNVAGAEVWVDGIRAGRTSEPEARLDLVLPVGRPSMIRVVKPGFAEARHTLSVPTAGRGTTTLHLVPSSPPSPPASFPLWPVFLGAGAILLAGAIRAWRSTRDRRRKTGDAPLAAATGATPLATFDRYVLGSRLGRGGVATIHLARDVTTGESVALKILDNEWLGDAEMVQKFLSEAEALGRISALEPSAPVVRVLRSGREGGRLDGIPFLAMELLEGETLAERVRRCGPLPEEDVRAIGAQLASCLETVHAAGIVHRDLSPDNVMVVTQGGSLRVTLFDFGIARQEALGDGALELSVAGKPWFMSPEQRRGGPLDGRSDLYSLGVLLYVVSTGQPPGEGSPAILPGVSPELRGILRDLLAERCEDRPASAAGVVERLRSSAPPAPLPPRLDRLDTEESFGTWRM